MFYRSKLESLRDVSVTQIGDALSYGFLQTDIVVFGIRLNCLTVVLWFLVGIRVIDDECKFSFWYIEIFAYYAYSLI